jgi:hypothetical protein
MDHALAAAILSVEELPGADPAVIHKTLGRLVAACSGGACFEHAHEIVDSADATATLRVRP